MRVMILLFAATIAAVCQSPMIDAQRAANETVRTSAEIRQRQQLIDLEKKKFQAGNRDLIKLLEELDHRISVLEAKMFAVTEAVKIPESAKPLTDREWMEANCATMTLADCLDKGKKVGRW